LRLIVNLGWGEDERAQKQPVNLDLRISFAEEPPACRTDLLDGTLCYAKLADKARGLCERRSFRLIEHLAREVHAELGQGLPAGAKLQVKIHKLHPPLADLFGGASFEYGDS